MQNSAFEKKTTVKCRCYKKAEKYFEVRLRRFFLSRIRLILMIVLILAISDELCYLFEQAFR